MILVILRKMRFILRYKYGILQTKTERIDVNFCENTTQILQYLEKKVGLYRNKIIVRFKRGKCMLRILPSWPLHDYGLEEGAQLHIESIENTETDKKNDHINNRYLNNVLGINKFNSSQMEEVKQKDNEEDEENPLGNQFSVRKYLDMECEIMLKEIQKNNLEGFRRIFESIPEDVPEEYLVEIKGKKLSLIDELGEKGWGAIHYAVFCQSIEVLDELLALEVDINKSTSDGWLPIQLAIEIKDITIIRKLLDEPPLNLNLQTIRGTALHTAARLGSQEIISMLLNHQIDVHIKDNSAKTALDVCLDEECKLLLKRYEEKKDNENQYFKGSLPLSLTTIFRGTVYKAKRPFMNLKERYLLVDPFQGSIIRYESPGDYPKRAKEITSLSKLRGIKLVSHEDTSWYMKDNYTYFMIEEPNKQVYACKHRRAAQSWVSNLALAVQFSKEFEKSPKLISDIKRSQTIIEDTQQIQDPKKLSKSKRSLFTSSLYTRQSLITNYPGEKDKHKLSEIATVNTSRPVDKEIVQETPAPKKSTDDKEEQIVYAEQFNSIANNKVNFASFNIIKILGSGAFGKVFLVRHIASGKQYALKALKKKQLIVKKNLKYAIFEANILKQANSPFIINLYYAFQTPNYLYLTLDYCPGKDLSFHIAREVTFTEADSKFYAAELLLAIEHLHEKKIIYRDLKPENILLDEEGHVKLADFGLSKQMGVDQKTKSFCGSPAYLSPEMLSQRGVGRESDIYGIGTVLFELLIGQPPYFSEDIPTLYRNIKQGKLKFPKSLSQNAKKIIISLLEREPKKRIGYNDLNQIKRHPFFHDIDWQKLQRKELQPPKRPELDDSDEEDDQLQFLNNKNAKFMDYDYDDQNKKINRLTNFSFIRE